MATRRERVVIELEDGLTAGVLREAAAVAVLNRELDKLSRDSVKAKQGMDPLARETIPQTTRNSDAAGKSIDKLSGRLELFARSIAAIGPATIPIGAVAIPAVTTLASGLGFLAIGTGTTVLAFHNLGDALTKFNKASAEPTATNIAAASAALDKIAPSAQQFVLELHKLGPELERLQQAAASGLFPGLTEGIAEAQSALPAVERIFHRVGTEIGTLSAEAGKSLGGRNWAPFLKFIGDEAPQALSTMAHATGTVAHGLAELWMATQPLSSGGFDWIEKAAQGFDHWATGLDQTKGFHDFMAYVQANGPAVEELLKTTGDLFVNLVKDAAPLGGPTLKALDDVLKILDLIAASPAGAPLIALVQALSVARLAMTGLSKVTGATFGAAGQLSLKKYGNGLRENIALWRELNATEKAAYLTSEEGARRATARSQVLGSLGKGAAALGAIGLVSTGVADKLGATNTAMDAMAGAMVGGVPGAVAGGLVGAFQDYRSAASKATSVTDALNRSIKASAGNIAAQQAALDQAQADRDANLKRHQSLGYDISHPFESLGGAISGLFGQTADQSTNVAIGAQRILVDDLKTAYGQLYDQLKGGTTSGPGGSSIVLTTQQLQAAATRAQPAMEALGITTGDLQKAAAAGDGSLGILTSRIAETTHVMDSNKGRTQAVTDALNGLDDKMQTTGQSAQALSDALSALFNPKLNLNAAHNAWFEALRGLNEQLAKGNNAILGNSDGALKNQDAIRSLTGQMLAYIQAQADAGKSSKVIQDTYKQQLGALIATATQLGINKHDLEEYLKTIGFTPKAISTLVNLKGLNNAERELRKFLRDRIIHITPHLDRLGASDTTAPGGHVLTGPGFADGGTVDGAPRRPYGDKVIIAAAPGEEIISNRHGEADTFRADRAAGRIPAYADGGKVARSYQRPDVAPPLMMQSRGQATPSIDYGRLTRALLAARPLYGNVHMQPHNYGEFKRQMAQDHALAAMSGVNHV